MGISAFSYENVFYSFWWDKESLKTCHPTELQNYKAKKRNLQSALCLNIWIFNSDLMTFREVLLLGFKWGKNWLSLWFAVWKKSWKKYLWVPLVRKRCELWQNGFYVAFSVLCIFYISSWNQKYNRLSSGVEAKGRQIFLYLQPC